MIMMMMMVEVVVVGGEELEGGENEWVLNRDNTIPVRDDCMWSSHNFILVLLIMVFTQLSDHCVAYNIALCITEMCCKYVNLKQH